MLHALIRGPETKVRMHTQNAHECIIMLIYARAQTRSPSAAAAIVRPRVAKANPRESLGTSLRGLFRGFPFARLSLYRPTSFRISRAEETR